MHSQRKTFFAFIFGLALFGTFSAQAQTPVTSRFQVLLDTDRNATTGCAVTTSGGRFDGAEMIVTTNVVTTGQVSTVTSVSRQTCADAATGTFSAPVTFDTTGWNVALGNNAMTVESHLPLQFLADSNATMRIGFIIATDTTSTSIFTTASGDPILFPPHGGRRRAVSAPGGERTILLDGAVEDWIGINPLLSLTGTDSFLSVRMFDLGDQLFFRIDVTTGASPGTPAPPIARQPIALDDAYDVVQGHSIHVNPPGVLGNDTDPLDPTKANLKANLTKPVQHGNLTLNPDGSFTYFHDASAPAPDNFGYRATNGAASSGNATVTLNVNPNHAPLALPHTYNVAHGGTLSIAPPGVLTGAVDSDGDAIRATVSIQPQHGTLVLQPNGSFVYTHDGSNTTGDSFGFRASDGISTAATIIVTIIVGPNAAPVAVNDPAAANTAAYTVAEGGTLNVAAGVGLIANDTDADTPKTQWTVTVVTPPAHGTLNVANDGSFVYVHDGSETTSDSFTYRDNDGIANSNVATAAITITPVNDAPVAVNDSYATLEDQPLNVPAAGVKANDTDSDLPAQTLSATVVANPAHGSVALNANGGFLYTPNPNFNGTDSFTYKINDTVADSNVATVTITVTAVNDVPAFTGGGNVTVNEDAGAQSLAWATGISAGPADEAGQTLTFNITGNSNSALFSVQPSISAAGLLTFTPAANAHGTATLQVNLKDNGGVANGGVDTTGTVSFDIIVNSVNDVPSFTKGADQTVNEDSGAQTVNGWATSLSKGPADEAGQTLNFLVSNSNNALFSAQPSIDASGNLTYTPAANVSGSAVVTVAIHDDGGTANGGVDTSANQTFTINVAQVNDVPSFTKGADITVAEDAGLVTNAGWATGLSAGPADESGQTLSFLVSNNNNGLFSVQPAVNAAGDLTFTTAPNAAGMATVTIAIHDDGGTANGGVDTSASQTFTITITPVNDAPVLGGPHPVTTNYTEGGAAVVIDPTVTITDVDSTMISGALIVISGNADGPGNDVLSFTNTATITGNFAANAGTLQLTGTDTVANYEAALRSITFSSISASPVLAPRYIDFNVTDNGGATSTNVLDRITITEVNSAPVITRPATATAAEDTPLAMNGANLISIADPDARSGSLSVTLGVTNGTLTLGTTTGLTVGGNGTNAVTLAGNLTDLNAGLASLSYLGANNYSGSDTLTIGVNDNGNTGTGPALSDSKSVAITVTAENDAPTLSLPGAQSAFEDTSKTFSTGNGNAITVADIDAGAGIVSLNLTSANGTITIGSLAGLNSNTGNGTGNVTITGTIAAINTSLEGTTFTSTADFSGTTAIALTLDDNGNTGNGGAQQATGSITMNVTAINDVPSFTKGADQTVLEDAAPQSVAGWATGISAGVSEGSQTVHFNVSNNNNALFSVQPAVDASGTLTYTLAANKNGTAVVTIAIQDDGGTANGGVDTSANQTFNINVTAVNDAPSFTKGADRTVLEDSGAFTQAGWATSLSTGPADESGQALNFIVSNDNNALFSVQPAVDASGQLTFTPAANAFGTATVSVQIHDDGGTANGGVDTSAVQTFVITVTNVNDAPSFTKGADQTVLEDAAPQTVPGWATALNAGPNEGSQTLDFLVTNNNNGLFSVQPAVSATGNLTYTLAANANGTATVSVRIHDDGGTANGGVDTSAAQTFSINVTAVNDVPSFTKGADVTALEDSGLFTQAGWATALSAGPADESGQTLNFVVSNDNNALFSVQPAVNAAGQLTFTPASNAFGTATVSVQIHDNGGTANGGVDTSAVQTFTITLTGVNDAPSFTKGADQTVFEDAAAQTVNGWATAISAGPSEGSQTVNFIVTNNNNALFSVQPAVDASGNLTYTLTPNANGSATVSVSIHDNGGTANGGVDTSAAQTFNITVTAVNDAPSFTKGADETVLEDSGLHTVNGWATAILAGPPDESGQTLTFLTSCTNPSFFSAAPAVSASGNLTYTLAANAFGSSTCTIHLQDNGGTANGGVDDSGNQTFTITITGVNDAPSFTKGADQTVLEDALPQTVNGWATGISAGPNEGSQTVNFIVTNNNNGLFSVQPAVSATGVLTYTLAANANGTALVSVSIHDDGGTANGGVDTSAAQTFNINVTAVNDAPSFTFAAGHVFVLADSGNNILPNWVQNRSKGPADEAGQTLTPTMTNDNNALFTVQPSVDMSTGSVSFDVAPGATGTATVSLFVKDNGGTANGGNDTSPTLTFTLTVEAAPSVISTSPINGGTIPRSAAVTINFSEQVNATVASFSVTCASTAQVFTISASPATSFTLTPDASQGSLWTAGNCSVVVNAAGVTDTDTDDPPNGMAANYNFTFVANTPPVANPDTYNAIGNVTITIPAATGILANDTDPDVGQTLSVTAGTFTTTGGGSITIAADGSLTYHTAANVNSGTDTYTYTLSDGATTTTGLITFNISGRYVYVQHDAAAGGNGRDIAPFQTITAAETALGAATGDTILVLTGGAGALDEGATLKNGQLLIGQGITTALTTTLNSQTITLLATGTPGLITRTSAGTALTLASGNTVKGLSITANNGAAMTGSGFGTLTTDLLSLTATGGAALDLTNGAFAAGSVLTSVTSSTSPGSGLALTNVTGTVAINGGTLSGAATNNFLVNGGSVSVTDSGNITAAAGALVSVVGTHTGTLTFQTGTLNATGGNGLQLTGGNGTYNFNGTTTLNGGGAQISIGGNGTFNFGTGTTVSNPAATAFLATGAPNVTFSGSLSQNTANGLISITNQTGGTITFQTGTVGASNGTGILLSNADGTVNFNSASTNLAGGVTLGYTINSGSSGTFNFSNTHAINTNGTAFTVTASNPTFSYPGSLLGGGKVATITTLSGGTIAFTGTISNGSAGTPTGQGISVASSTGGTVTFSGSSKTFFTGTNPTIALTTNPSAAINFTGGNLAITTTSGAAFAATGGGTVTVTGASNTVTTGSGVAVNIANTTVGAAGVTFRSVNTNGAAANGIILTSTGNVGTFSVTGDGSTAGSGGTIQGTTGAAVALSTMSTSSTSLAFMNLIGSAAGNAINGSTFGTLAVNTVALSTANNFTIASLNTGTVNGSFSSIGGTINGNVVGVVLSAVGGNFTVASGTLASGTGAPVPDLLQITGGNATIGWGGSLTEAKAGSMVNVSGTNSGSITFSGTLTNSAGSLGLFFNTANGTYVVNGTATFTGAASAVTILNSTGSFNFGSNVTATNTTATAVRIGSSPTTAGTPVVLFAGALSQNAAPVLVSIYNVTGGSTSGIASPYSILFSGNITKTGGAGAAIDVNTNSNGAVGFTGTLSLNTGAANAFTVANCTGGSTAVTGDLTTTTTSGIGVNLSANTGHTFQYAPTASNNLTITSGTGAGFSATGGGTVSVSGTTNAVTSAGGAAVNIANTTIGGSNVSFQSVTATGGANGIVLNNTGASGSLIVTGNAGSCFSTASTCTGGTISGSTGSAISLTNTRGPSFSFMKITNIALSGVRGTTVTNFTMASCVIDGVNTSHTADDSNIGFNLAAAGTENNVSGTVSITNCTLNNSYQHGIDITQYNGTISQLTVTNNSFTSGASGSSFGSAVRLQMLGSAATSANLTKASINNNIMRNFPAGDGVIINAGNSTGGPTATAGSSGSNVVDIKNNDVQGASAAAYMLNAFAVAVNKKGTGNFNIDGNGTPALPVKFIGGNGVSCGAFGSVTVTCTINNNYFDLFNIANSAGINIGGDQTVVGTFTETPNLTANVTNNIVKDCDGNGILATMKNTAGTGKFAIQNNNIDAPLHSPNPGFTMGIRVDSGTNAGGTDNVCLNISGNTTAGDSTAGGTLAAGIGIRHEHSVAGHVFNVHGFTPSSPAASENEAIAFIAAANPNSAVGTAGTKVNSISGGGTFGNCTYTYP